MTPCLCEGTLLRVAGRMLRFGVIFARFAALQLLAGLGGPRLLCLPVVPHVGIQHRQEVSLLHRLRETVRDHHGSVNPPDEIGRPCWVAFEKSSRWLLAPGISPEALPERRKFDPKSLVDRLRNRSLQGVVATAAVRCPL